MLATQSRQSTELWSILILIFGVVAGLVVAAAMTGWLMRPTGQEITSLVSQLALSSAGSVSIGFIVYYSIARRSPSLSFSLAFAYMWTAVLVGFNVWNGARLMFFESHDFTLALILLVFAAIIATSFGISVTSRAASDLRELSRTADLFARGYRNARAVVRGQDEVSRVASSFNEMADRLQEAEQTRVEMERLRRDLVAWTSHDLRTPLTSMRAMIEAMSDGVVTDEETRQRYYRTIRQDIIALNTLFDDLFELSQLEAGGLDLEMAPGAISDLVSDTLEQFDALAKSNGIALRGEIDRHVDPITLNAEKISRVLGNLVSNALHYTPAGGEIVVSVANEDEQWVHIAVRDSGSGFDPADLERVFEQFYRGDQSRTRAKGGGGLGLAIARGVVEAHGGHIWATNAESGGAIVQFTLPRSAVNEA